MSRVDIVRGCSAQHKQKASVAQVAAVWQNEAQLAAVSQAAAVKARSWTEAANAAALLHLLHSAVDMSNMKHSRLGNKQLL